MTITITLQPIQEKTLQILAKQCGVSLEAYIEGALVGQYPLPSTQKPSEVLRQWQQEGVIPMWSDRTEDSPELARKLRSQFAVGKNIEGEVKGD